RAPEHRVFNVGTGRGTSVREIIDGLRRVSGIDFEVLVEERRAGDPPHLIGDPKRLSEGLGWRAHRGLDDILKSAWEGWQSGPRRIAIRE
ncbi:MAG: UDP-glucose 4-epimerase GalE, partial [Schaalia hyovaginalis]|nr:UDP-glucose 4-epimerase GalE [Schaalia hyovaginalis]